MILRITADAWWDSHVDKVVYWLLSTEFREFLNEKSYGEGLNCVGIVLVCRAVDENIKRRVRFHRNEKRIAMDVMLSLDEFRNFSPDERRRKVIDSLLKDVPDVIKKYRIDDFDAEKFIFDFRQKLLIILLKG